MAEDSPKRRKANFNEAETEVLIEQVLKHEQVLFAAGPGRASPGQKRRVWELIRHKVNPVAACPREVEDLKKRWRDLKRRDRSKLCRASHGPAPHPAALGLLLAPDELSSPPDLLRSYGAAMPGASEALPIVGGIDTLDLPGASVADAGEWDAQPCSALPWPDCLRRWGCAHRRPCAAPSSGASTRSVARRLTGFPRFGPRQAGGQDRALLSMRLSACVHALRPGGTRVPLGSRVSPPVFTSPLAKRDPNPNLPRFSKRFLPVKDGSL